MNRRSPHTVPFQSIFHDLPPFVFFIIERMLYFQEFRDLDARVSYTITLFYAMDNRQTLHARNVVIPAGAGEFSCTQWYLFMEKYHGKGNVFSTRAGLYSCWSNEFWIGASETS
jgi:hypothetical protein